MSDPFADLPKGHFKTIYADPPWRFKTWNNATAVQARGSKSTYTSASVHYETMPLEEICALPVAELAAPDCVLFMWACWPLLPEALKLIDAWGFTYKTCGFDWVKAHAKQIDLFRDDVDGQMGMGYWTRANTEPCLLATRGKPKRVSAAVRQAIIEPRREHSRKPLRAVDRIERLVAGPYLELFARQQRPGWTVWGNQTDKFSEAA